MAASCLTISAAIIYFFNSTILAEKFIAVCGTVELMTMTLMPYMISAVIASITAIGVISILPAVRMADPAERILMRLREAAGGNLSARVKLHGDVPLKDVAAELNVTLSTLGSQIATWKLINRQQWGTLCRVRLAAENEDISEVIKYVAEMEQNWDKIAEIEQRIIT